MAEILPIWRKTLINQPIYRGNLDQLDECSLRLYPYHFSDFDAIFWNSPTCNIIYSNSSRSIITHPNALTKTAHSYKLITILNSVVDSCSINISYIRIILRI